MADENDITAAGDSTEEAIQIRMKLLTQYIRDMSFENILSRKGAAGKEINPEVQINIAIDAHRKEAEGHYDVVQKFRISSHNKHDKQPIFILELEYVGLFQIEGLPEDRIHPFLMIECARFMFPFIRRIVLETTQDGGMPPLNLEVVDYAALYRQHVEQQQQTRQKAN